MKHKGHYGKYTGNAKWSKDHADTKVTKSNYKASERDDAAHIDYLKRDVLYDNKHGHSDKNMTADEKHISKLAGDMKYDKKHHGSPAKSVGAHSMRPGDYASHLKNHKDHKAPSDEERKGRKHKSDVKPTNNPPAKMVSPARNNGDSEKDPRSGRYPNVEPSGISEYGQPIYPQSRLGRTQYANDPDKSLYNRETNRFDPIPFSAADSINAIQDDPRRVSNRNKDYAFEVALDDEMAKRKLDAKYATQDLLNDIELNNRYGGKDARVGSFNKELRNYTGKEVFTVNQAKEIAAARDKELLRRS